MSDPAFGVLREGTAPGDLTGAWPASRQIDDARLTAWWYTDVPARSARSRHPGRWSRLRRSCVEETRIRRSVWSLILSALTLLASVTAASAAKPTREFLPGGLVFLREPRRARMPEEVV